MGWDPVYLCYHLVENAYNIRKRARFLHSLLDRVKDYQAFDENVDINHVFSIMKKKKKNLMFLKFPS